MGKRWLFNKSNKSFQVIHSEVSGSQYYSGYSVFWIFCIKVFSIILQFVSNFQGGKLSIKLTKFGQDIFFYNCYFLSSF